MWNNFSVEAGRYVQAFVPIDTTGAGQTGDYVNLRNYRRCAIILSTGAWAGGTAAVTLNQAKTNAGGSAKAVAFTRYWLSSALSSTTDVPVETAVTSNTFNISAANKVHVIEVHVNDLDIANGFFWLNVATASPSTNSDLISGVYYLYNAAYALKADTGPITVV